MSKSTQLIWGTQRQSPQLVVDKVASELELEQMRIMGIGIRKD